MLVVLCNGRDMSEIPKLRTGMGRARPDAERLGFIGLRIH